MELIECIPNVSEGRDPKKIEALAHVIRSTPGISLLHIDSGYAANRTVFTYTGDIEAVHDATFELYKKAYELIDMREHLGTHPRMGAIDVCPFVPLSGCSANDLIDMAMRLAFELVEALGICGYYYEYSAIQFDRVNLARLRKGGYESLPDKFKSLEPDFGDGQNWPRFGSTVIGVRKPLVAFNVNLDTRDVEVAKLLAAQLRTFGKGEHKLKAAKAIGWYIEDFDRVQLSFNLYDLNLTSLIEAFEACKTAAHKLGIEVTGSELVGLTPMIEFVKVYNFLSGAQLSELNEEQLNAAVNYLNLNEVKPFYAEEQIIERAIQSKQMA